MLRILQTTHQQYTIFKFHRNRLCRENVSASDQISNLHDLLQPWLRSRRVGLRAERSTAGRRVESEQHVCNQVYARGFYSASNRYYGTGRPIEQSHTGMVFRKFNKNLLDLVTRGSLMSFWINLESYNNSRRLV